MKDTFLAHHLTFGEPGSLGVTCLEPPNNPLFIEGQPPPPKQGDLNSNQKQVEFTPFWVEPLEHLRRIPGRIPDSFARSRSECYHFHAVVASLHCAPSNLRFVDGCYPPVVGPVGVGRSQGSLRWSRVELFFLFGDGGLRSKNSPRNHEIRVSFEGSRSLPTATVKLGEVSNGFFRKSLSGEFIPSNFTGTFQVLCFPIEHGNCRGVGPTPTCKEPLVMWNFFPKRWTYRTCFKPSDCHDNSRPKTPIKISREMVPICLKGCLRNSPTKSSNHTNSGKKHRVLQASTIHIA